MRHTSTTLGTNQLRTAERHEALRDEINSAFTSGSHYPWTLLSRLQAEKFYSDIIESLLGAVYVDSGSFDACRQVLERMKIFDYLDRVIKDNVHILHPKEELGQLADTKKVRYEVGLTKSISSGKEKREYACRISVSNKTPLE
jgi:dsRNA-specific ribonuclease